MKPNELREAIMTIVDISDPIESRIARTDAILDAVIASLPEPINPDKPHAKFDVGRISYYADIHTLLQSAKSISKESDEKS